MEKDYFKISNSIVRESLRIAMIDLLKKKDYNEISITALCERAGVSRTGFYRNYSEKKEVIFDIIREFYDDYRKNSKFPGVESIGTEEWYYELFTYIRMNFNLFRILMEPIFLKMFFRISDKYLMRYVPDTPVDKGRVLIWAGGLYNLVFWWINVKNPSEVETVVKTCMDYLPEHPFKMKQREPEISE